MGEKYIVAVISAKGLSSTLKQAKYPTSTCITKAIIGIADPKTEEFVEQEYDPDGRINPITGDHVNEKRSESEGIPNVHSGPNVSWSACSLSIQKKEKAIRVEVYDIYVTKVEKNILFPHGGTHLDELIVKGHVIVDLSKTTETTGTWFKLQNTSSGEVQIAIFRGKYALENPENIWTSQLIKKSLYQMMEDALSPADQASFFTAESPKATTIELFYHVHTNHFPPIRSPAWKAFGFENCSVQDEKNLLGLYIGLITHLRTTVDEIHNALLEDNLVGLIEEKFKPLGTRGGMYFLEWFPKNKDKLVRNKCCKKCGATTKLLKCAGCQKAFYCNQEHQKADWANHKEFCKREKNNKTTIQLKNIL